MSKSSGNPLFIYMISCVAAIAGMLFGYDTGVISGAILFIKKDFDLTPVNVGTVVSAVLLGALMGSAFSGRVTDYLGRRKALLIACIIFIIASVSSAMAIDTNMLIASRLILGLAIGIASYSAPLYLAEVAPAEIRGMLVSLNQLAITIGIVLSYLVDLYFSTSGEWRWMLGFGILPATILLLGLTILPESPRWMALKGKVKEAQEVLQKLRNSNNVSQEMDSITSSVSDDQCSWRDFFAKKLRPVIYIALGLAFFQQATGVNTIIYYAPTIFEMAGFEHANSAILATLGVGIVNVLFTVLSLFMIDKLGRRPLLFIGLIGMMVSLIAVGLVFSKPDLEGGRWVAVGCVVAYIACFAISLGPIAWLMISEIFPLRIRALGTSLATAAVWLFNMLVAFSFPIFLEEIGKSNTFYLYALTCFIGFFFVKRFVPETKGCSLETIEKNLNAGKAARDLGCKIS